MSDIESVPEHSRPSKGIAVTNWLLSKTTGLLERKTSRRGFLVGTAMAGSAVAVAGCQFATQPGTAYNRITDCSGGLCRDGYTEFCCAVNKGLNSCPPGSFAGGWWRADHSSFCGGGTRYYIDCMQNCCGPRVGGQAPFGQQFCASCTECRCAGNCNTRRVYCNYFRYGQCHMEITQSGPIACRVVSCVPPWSVAEYACNPNIPAVDNATAEHAGNCLQTVDPVNVASLVPPVGSAATSADGAAHVLVRGVNGSVYWNRATGSAWQGWRSLGGAITSTPQVVRFDGVPGGLVAFARGTDFGIWFSSFNGTGWSAWNPLHGIARSDPAPAVVAGRLVVFIRGSDRAVHARTLVGSSWTGWQSFGGGLTSSPTVTTGPMGTFIFGRAGDRSLWYRRFDGTRWLGWAGLGGGLTSEIAAVSTDSEVIVAVRGNGGLFHRRFNGSGWTGWSGLGGDLTSDPVLVRDPDNSDGALAFARGKANDGLWWQYDGSAWSGPSSLGGSLSSDLAAASDPTSGAYLFTASGTTPYFRRRQGGTWSGWSSLGGRVSLIRAV
jgi:hypothetical protein